MVAARFPVEEGAIASFARAIGDANTAYYGPDAVAPPTFVQSSAQWDDDYVLRPKIGGDWWGSGRDPGRPPQSAGSGTGLHAEQHYEYVRPVRVGDVLTATTKPGQTWEKEGRRAGKLVFTEHVTEYHDQHGELVVIARGVAVRTEKPVDAS